LNLHYTVETAFGSFCDSAS